MGHLRGDSKTFLESLTASAALAPRQVVEARADLKQKSHERNLVPHRLEEQLFERVAGFEPVSAPEPLEPPRESRVVFERG